jgi:hypothetical protein
MQPVRTAPRALVAALTLFAGASASHAQWTSDAAVNNPISTAANGQDVCKVAGSPDGSTWFAWYTSVPAPEFYNVRIQRLDRAGVAQLGPDGMLVSNFVVGSATFGDMDLRTDSAGNALLVFNDQRPGTSGGTDLELSAYRIAPDGSMLWGPNGVQLTDDTFANNTGRIAQTTDGNFTVVFDRVNGAAGNTPPRGLLMQRIDATGNILLAPGGVLIAGSGVGGAVATDGPGFQNMVASDNNSVIVIYGRDTRSFTSARRPTIQKYSDTGVGLWNGGLAIELSTSVFPVSTYPPLLSDGAGGAIVSWLDSRTGVNQCWVQRLNAAGTLAYAAGGASAGMTAGQLRFSGTTPIVGPQNEVYVFWSETSSSQGSRAIYGQRLNADGSRAWGDAGIALTPFDTEIEEFIRSAPVECGAAGAIVTWKDTQPATINSTVQAIRVDGDGDVVWTTSPLIVSSVLSSKGRFPIATLPDSSSVLLWSDNRTDANDLYAMKINTDGTLGGPVLCPADFNRSGVVSVQDIFDFLAAYFNNDPCADFNHSGAVTVQDIFDFLAAYFTACP